ncbi:unnamed protein product [Oppiella nova]|uniref:GAF domain-containing protein n=1 Tax=Oppiella nova TaxID=334625 RepID=A0A7R9M1W1_9ACAR|nr:unnamed protein product [Oppiella nova]CAG2169231.1 unnamed protein product [Oppiella nova]
MKLISDITNELDINTLCHKILVNVSILTNSDRGSLFLAKGSRDNRYLEAKLFDVTSDSLLKDALSAAQLHTHLPLPFGSGIAGHVALTKENVNITDAYQMCQPILNFSGDVIGVAQCINKNSHSLQQSFTKRDEQVSKTPSCLKSRSIFQETSSLDALINKIMIKAQGLLHSDKCRVYLVDIEGQQFQEIERPGIVCDNDCVLSVPIFNNESKVIGVSQLVKIKGHQFNDVDISTLESKVIGVSQLVKIKGHQFNDVDISTLESKVIGVSQLVKIKGHQFNDVDISTLEALKLTAKQKVALEVLSYHASASIDETKILMGHLFCNS